MDKTDPRIYFILAFILSVVAAIFTLSVLTNNTKKENPFIKTDSVVNETVTQTPIPPTIIPSSFKITEFISDKDSYRSQETISFTLKIYSEEDTQNADLKIEGIKPGSTSYINKTKSIDIKSGDNIILISAQAPNCTSGCGGVYPGPYEITAQIILNEKPVSQSQTTINLVGN